MFIEHLLSKKPIIAAIKSIEDLKRVSSQKIDILFILRSKLSNLNQIVEKAIDLDTLVLVHIDMVKGIGNDKEAIKYLAREVGIDGILTTKSYLIKAAKQEDLITIQRLFLLDSESLKTGINIVKNTKPDLIEVLPGLITPEMINDLKSEIDIPIIAGGLITTTSQVKKVLSQGVVGISTSEKSLWEMKF